MDVAIVGGGVMGMCSVALMVAFDFKSVKGPKWDTYIFIRPPFCGPPSYARPWHKQFMPCV